MARFAFSLQRVLDYRRLEEGWAEEAMRLAREKREAAEEAVAAIRARRTELLSHTVHCLADRLHREAYHEHLDREEERAQDRLALCVNDEARAVENWQECRQAAEALEKLRESALDEWKRDEARREQAELDEWAVTRR